MTGQGIWRVVGLAVLVLFAGAPTANAQVGDPDPDFWRGTSQRENAVAGLVYAESAQPVPTSLGAVGPTVTALREAERALPPGNSASKEIWKGLRNLGPGSGLTQPWRALGTIALAVGTFELGVKIGTGINAKYLKIGLPDPPEPKSTPASGWLQFREKDTATSFNTTPLPEDAWVLWYPYASQQWHAVNLYQGWDGPAAYLTGRPAFFNVLSGNASIGWGIQNPPVESYWIGENDLDALGPIEDFTGQSYGKALGSPTAPSVAAVQQAIALRLALQEYDRTRAFLNYHLGSPGQGDPTSNSFNMPDCVGETWQACEAALADRGVTMYRTYEMVEDSSVPEGSITASDPAAGSHIDPDDTAVPVVAHIRINPNEEDEGQICDDPYVNDRTTTDPSSLTQPGNPLEFTQVPPTVGLIGPLYGAAVNPFPTQDGDSVPVYYGNATNSPTGWKGFGWYKIKAKHGWSATADQRTRQALLTGLRWTQSNGRQFYLDFGNPFEVTRAGGPTQECAQFVVVDRVASPRPLGIVTSFGRDLPGFVAGLMR